MSTAAERHALMQRARAIALAPSPARDFPAFAKVVMINVPSGPSVEFQRFHEFLDRDLARGTTPPRPLL